MPSMILTQRQLEVYRLKKEGNSNRQIAETLGVSEAYISQALTRIVEKIQSVEDTIQVLIQLGEFRDAPRYELTDEGRVRASLPSWVKDVEPFKPLEGTHSITRFFYSELIRHSYPETICIHARTEKNRILFSYLYNEKKLVKENGL